MSDTEKKGIVEKLYGDGGYLDAPGCVRSLTDDAALEMIGEHFFKAPEPPVVVKEVIPPGFVADPDAMEYHATKKDPLFEEVRDKMLAELSPDEKEDANTDFTAFNWHYRRIKEGIVQDREEKAAKEKAAMEKIQASKDRLRKIMEGSDPSKAKDAEARYFERFVK